jgi:hypothetical protein
LKNTLAYLVSSAAKKKKSFLTQTPVEQKTSFSPFLAEPILQNFFVVINTLS